MLDSGETLLFALTAWREVSLVQFRRLFDRTYVPCLVPGDTATYSPLRYQQSHAAAILDALGHCDMDATHDPPRIVAAPQVLAGLPSAGLPRAVLCGGRGPDTVREVERAVKGNGALRISVASQAGLVPYAPRRIEIQGNTVAELESVARDLGMIAGWPSPANSLIGASENLREYLDTLAWTQRPELDWPREDFDPERLRFVESRNWDGDVRLSRYQDPVRKQFIHWLWRGVLSTQVSSEWGRWAILNTLGRQVLEYQPANGLLSIPGSLRLPRLVARALVLCSGWVPGRRKRAASRRAGGDEVPWDQYSMVSPDFFSAVAGTLGQG